MSPLAFCTQLQVHSNWRGECLGEEEGQINLAHFGANGNKQQGLMPSVSLCHSGDADA